MSLWGSGPRHPPGARTAGSLPVACRAGASPLPGSRPRSCQVLSMSDGDPRVAVVMITWNRRAEVLRSLANFTVLPERPRILVVDNGSTDGTAEAVAAQFPQVEILEAGKNLGAAGRTLAARRVTAPYVPFADDAT